MKRRLALSCLLSVVATISSSQQKSLLDDLAIEVKTASRAFIYTNKESAHYYGETSAPNAPGWMGFTVFGHRFIDDYVLLADGEPLDRSVATVLVYPDYLTRTYPNGIIEQLRIVDGEAMFALIVTSPEPTDLSVIPLFSDGHVADAYEIRLSESMASIARKSHLKRSDRDDYPVWLSIYGKGFLLKHNEYRKGNEYSPILLSDRRSKTHVISFSVADVQAKAERLSREYFSRAANYFNKRRTRMERLLQESTVKTGDEKFDRALAWSKISLDALIMNQSAQGIYAGLPWFNNYWGRDTFISLPGATLVTGRFAEAKELIRSFAAFQMLDSNSTDYGRIPNIVTTTSKAYNTADGTPRFVMMAKEYIERAGDQKFLLEMYPTVLRSIEGTIRYHNDSLGFLTHGDAETWMDAVGPDGPWTPRGDRANDIQALWAQQLDAGVWFATRVGDPVSARAWFDRGTRLRKNFLTHFVSKGVVADRLMTDGTRDITVRPNQIFTSFLLPDSLRARVVGTVIRELTYPYGVASLSQRDDNFHPYHQYPQYYPKDAAYHNGTVWTWLQGPLIGELCTFGKQDVAAKLTMNAVHQILDRGAVGTQSELLDAIPRPGEAEPRLSGTVSQAWNLAEFIRTFYDCYLGVRVHMLSHTVSIAPHIPEAFGDVSARISLDKQSFTLDIQRDGELTTVALDGKDLKEELLATIEVQTGASRSISTNVRLYPRAKVRLDLNGEEVTVNSNGPQDASTSHRLNQIANYESMLGSLDFARPVIRSGLVALQGPEYPLLTNADVKSSNPSSKLLVDVQDAKGDDKGTSSYTYPTNPLFLPGIFDLTDFRVTYDSSKAYFTLRFRALSDPGWHPEYGFQLTEAAIAIDEDGIKGSGALLVRDNANYILDSLHGYERLILVGGGVRVENGSGHVLASYVPTEADTAHPLGSALTGTITFAIPLAYLGTPRPTWTFTVLSGAQDDHGGAGIGEFRTVQRQAGEWNGGGKRNPDDSNVYDVLVAPRR